MVATVVMYVNYSLADLQVIVFGEAEEIHSFHSFSFEVSKEGPTFFCQTKAHIVCRRQVTSCTVKTLPLALNTHIFAGAVCKNKSNA